MSSADRSKFRYYLKAADSTYYYVSGGTVVTTAIPTPIIKDPLEWSETTLRWKRHERYKGIFREFAVPMSFVEDAAKILRHIFYTQEGIESVCILYIEKKKERTQSAAGDETYEFYYEGDIDFSQKKDTLNYFQVALLDRGLADLIKAYESTPFEIPVTVFDCLNIYMDGLRLKNTTIITLANDITAGSNWHQMQPTMLIQSSESEVKVDIIEQPNQQGLGSALLITDFPFFKSAIDGSVTIDYNVSLQAGNVPGLGYGTSKFSMVIAKYNAATNTSTLYRFYTGANPVALHTAVGTITIQVLKDETLSYFAGVDPFDLTNGSGVPLVSHTYNYSTLTVHYDTKLDSSVVRAYRYYQLFQKLIALLTKGKYGVYSDFLSNPNLTTVDCRPWNVCVTSGDGLRRLAWQPGFWAALNFLVSEKIVTSLEELNDDARDRWMTGIGIENIGGVQVVRMEHESHFFQNVVIADLGEITKMEIPVALDQVYNLLKTGYENQQLDALNGKDDPFTTSTFSLPITRKKAEWNMVAPYIPSMYAIEFQRANLTDKKTTDSKSDNDTFVIEIADNPVAVTIGQPLPYTGNAYPLARKQNSPGNSASGLISPDMAFNLSLTPKRNLIRNGSIIRTALHMQDSKVITFQTADKNADVVCNLGSGSIRERDDVGVSGLSAPLYLPMLFQFETRVPSDIPAIMAANPYGKIQFTYQGNVYAGYVYEIGIKPSNNAVYTWKLLAAADIDISKLER